MKALHRLVVLMITTILLNGCGSSFLAIKPEEKQSIKHIAINNIKHPGYQMINKGSGAAVFGVIGAVTIGTDGISLTKRLNEVIYEEKFQINKELESELSKLLKQDGYIVHIIKIQRIQENVGFKSF